MLTSRALPALDNLLFLLNLLPGCCLCLLIGAAGADSGTAAPPSGVDIARASNVVWREPDWTGPAGPDDGSGALPIGNGDVAAPVWVDPTTGDLRVISDCHFTVQLNHFIPDSRTDSVAVLRK
jgi:hypothetical protein